MEEQQSTQNQIVEPQTVASNTKKPAREVDSSAEDDTGFSLVEIMAIVAILGILLSIALASFSTARAKTIDKAIMSTLMSVQLRGVSLYEKYGCYTYTDAPGNCPDPVNPVPDYNSNSCAFYLSNAMPASNLFRDQDVRELIDYAAEKANVDLNSLNCITSKDLSSWAVSAPLRSDATQYFCVDSKRNSRLVTPASVPGSMTGDRGFSGTACK